MSKASMLGNWEGSHTIGGIHDRDQDNSGEMHYFNLSTMLAATNNFSDANKLGEGGFGPVYKVKRLTSFFVTCIFGNYCIICI
jgi:hypothetical protein